LACSAAASIEVVGASSPTTQKAGLESRSRSALSGVRPTLVRTSSARWRWPSSIDEGIPSTAAVSSGIGAITGIVSVWSKE